MLKRMVANVINLYQGLCFYVAKPQLAWHHHFITSSLLLFVITGTVMLSIYNMLFKYNRNCIVIF